jgi:hypothetical protein
MPKSTLKEEVLKIIEHLPDDATWGNLQYAIDVHRSIEAGLKDSQTSRTVSLEEARRRFGFGTSSR